VRLDVASPENFDRTFSACSVTKYRQVGCASLHNGPPQHPHQVDKCDMSLGVLPLRASCVVRIHASAGISLDNRPAATPPSTVRKDSRLSAEPPQPFQKANFPSTLRPSQSPRIEVVPWETDSIEEDEVLSVDEPIRTGRRFERRCFSYTQGPLIGQCGFSKIPAQSLDASRSGIRGPGCPPPRCHFAFDREDWPNRVIPHFAGSTNAPYTVA